MALHYCLPSGEEHNTQSFFSSGDNNKWFSFIQFSSVAQSCPTLCNPMNHSTPGLPVHHQLPEFTQTHVHRVCDADRKSTRLNSRTPNFCLFLPHAHLYVALHT